jgi:hypothetical protein
MTKFGRSGKTGPSHFLFRSIWFYQVQRRIKTAAKFEYLKIQGVLRHENRLRGVKGPRWEKSKPKVEGYKNQTIQFWIPEYPVFLEQIKSD